MTTESVANVAAPILYLGNDDCLLPSNPYALEVVSEEEEDNAFLKYLESVEDHSGLKVILYPSPAGTRSGRTGGMELATLGSLVKVDKQEGGDANIILQGLERVLIIDKHRGSTGALFGNYVALSYTEGDDDYEDLKALKGQAEKVLQNSVYSKIKDKIDEDDTVGFCFVLAEALNLNVDEKKQLLYDILSIHQMIEFLRIVCETKLYASEAIDDAKNRIKQENIQLQKNMQIKQQIKALQDKLGESDDEIDELEARIHKAKLPTDAEKFALKQLKKMSNLQSSSSEFSVTQGHLDFLLSLPWEQYKPRPVDVDEAKKILDGDHYGLEKTKKRILEYIAVYSLKADTPAPILCMVGPPGTGKTTLAKSIAKSLGRPFERISLGGVHDESEIRGHRRTYVGAMAGKILKAIARTGSSGPVLLLDEIDKLGKDFRGDPAAALLEVLDPGQNTTFVDHYLETPYDLSKVVFICTANDLSTIPRPLKDRMEIIEVPSYTLSEKREIGLKHLLEVQTFNHGLKKGQVTLTPEVMSAIIEGYTREAGVRNLGKRLADICRSVAVDVSKLPAKERDAHTRAFNAKEELVDILGHEIFTGETRKSTSRPGVATGLAWTPVGGDVLFIEAQKIRNGKGDLHLTGRLGAVMKESAQAALSLIRSSYEDISIKDIDIHLHVPDGATPKDGPSAGVTIYLTLLSLLTDQSVQSNLAMTGEINLSGDVLAVGGIREKVVAAHRAGITKVLIPKANKKDIDDIPQEVRDSIDIQLVENVSEVRDHGLS